MAKNRIRVELFFKTKSELKDRVSFLRKRGVNAFNLVNKDKKDALKIPEWLSTIQTEAPGSDVCAHWSLRYNKSSARDGGDDASFDKLSSFLDDTNSQEVLLISGSGEKRSLDAVSSLTRLQAHRSVAESTGSASNVGPKICVAFNPFFPDENDRKVEKDRLRRKIESLQVDKVYLQFGTNLSLLKDGLDYLRTLNAQDGFNKVDVCGSIFLPTKKLIAQQKFRPWNGVFLSDEFLSGEDGARQIVVEMMKLYNQYQAEILFEAPGIRNEKDALVMESLLEQISGEFSRDEKLTPAKRTRVGAPVVDNVKKPSSIPGLSPLVNPSLLSSPCVLVFGSFDVRLHDNRAVEFASFHSAVVPVFLWNKEEEGQWGVRGALEVVLKNALKSLDGRLKENGLKLVCRDTSDTAKELLAICKEVGASVVYSNVEHTPESASRDTKRTKLLAKNDIQHIQASSSLLYDPTKISLSTGFSSGHFATLMPFLKTCKKELGEPPRPPLRSESDALVANMCAPEEWPTSLNVNDLPLAVVAGASKWDEPILERFPMSEDNAQHLLDTFMTKEPGLKRYESQRSRADLDGTTSKLSAHLRIGTLSPYELYYRTEDSSLSKDAKKTFSRRLFWRDLAYYQLHCFNFMRDRSIRRHYEDTEWIDGKEEEKRFNAWKRGRTGYPIVDAAMRELWETGWMTQSVRMVAASFLVEYLRVNWVKGAEWFHYTLVDADSAINPMMWQNAGRSGIDQWNFVLSPENASQDPTGSYTKRWVPELAKLPKNVLHQPWKASEKELKASGVVLGSTYPHRIVEDLKKERRKSVESVLNMRRNAQEYNDDAGYDMICLPSGDMTKVFTIKEYRIDRSGAVIKFETSSKKQGGGGRSTNRKGGNQSKTNGLTRKAINKKAKAKKLTKREMLKKAAI